MAARQPTVYPCVPGHEIVGRVSQTGDAATRFKEGDIAAVGCMVDSCRTCASCRAGEEQYCDSFPILTYNAKDRHLGGMTYGGYSDSIVVDEAFVLRVSDKLNLAGAAPPLCAGITTYSPLRRWNVGKGQKVGVVGLGGLGHMGVKFAVRLAPKSCSSQRLQTRSRTGYASVLTKWWYRKTKRRCKNIC